MISHVEPDWGRFLYGALSLCEHPVTYNVETLTVVNSCILSLDITDGQSEVTVSSTATESGWSPRLKCCGVFDYEFRSCSRFLLVPEQVRAWFPCIIHITAGFTVESDWSSLLNSFHCRSLSHSDLSIWLCSENRKDSEKYLTSHTFYYFFKENEL